MITHRAPQDYVRRKPVFPQTTRVCFRCGGTCVCLPLIGIACLNCRGKKYITVPDSQVLEWRAEIEKANRYATFPAYTTGPKKG